MAWNGSLDAFQTHCYWNSCLLTSIPAELRGTTRVISSETHPALCLILVCGDFIATTSTIVSRGLCLIVRVQARDCKSNTFINMKVKARGSKAWTGIVWYDSKTPFFGFLK